MAGLEAIAMELGAALDRLEHAASQLLEARARTAETETENAALRAERVQLLARIAELEDNVRALTGVTDEIEDRLDGAISEIRTALAR
jgi:predicted phage-related endonuclease